MHQKRQPRFSTSIDLEEGLRESMIALLNQQLADTFDLQTQLKQAHWNVKGMQFIALHELFDELAAQVRDFVDDIAERAVQLGGYAYGTARMAAAATRLPEFPTDKHSSKAHVALLVERFALLAASTREGIGEAEQAGDADTADLLTEISRGLDKSLWFLEAHIQE